MPLYRKTRVMGQDVDKSKQAIDANKLPVSIVSKKWSYVPVSVRNRTALAVSPPIALSLDNAVTERTVRRIIRQIENVPTLKGYELLCEVDNKLYTNRRQVYGNMAKAVK